MLQFWCIERGLFLETDSLGIKLNTSLLFKFIVETPKEKGKRKKQKSPESDEGTHLVAEPFCFVKLRYWYFIMVAYQAVLRNWSFAAFCSRRRYSQNKTKKEKAEITWAGGRYATCWRRYDKAYQGVLRNWSFFAFRFRRRNSKRKTKKEKAEITGAGGRYAPCCRTFLFCKTKVLRLYW